MSELRDKILAIKDIPEEIVEVPEWDNVRLLVRGLTGRQRAILLQDTMDAKGKLNFQKLEPELISLCALDPDTKEQVFGKGDLDALAEKSGAALQRVAQVAQRLSGLEPQAMEEAEKN